MRSAPHFLVKTKVKGAEKVFGRAGCQSKDCSAVCEVSDARIAYPKTQEITYYEIAISLCFLIIVRG